MKRLIAIIAVLGMFVAVACNSAQKDQEATEEAEAIEQAVEEAVEAEPAEEAVVEEGTAETPAEEAPVE